MWPLEANDAGICPSLKLNVDGYAMTMFRPSSSKGEWQWLHAILQGTSWPSSLRCVEKKLRFVGSVWWERRTDVLWKTAAYWKGAPGSGGQRMRACFDYDATAWRSP